MPRFVVTARVVVTFTRTVEVDGTRSPINPAVIGAARAAVEATGRAIPGSLHETCGLGSSDFVGIDGDATIVLIGEPEPEEPKT